MPRSPTALTPPPTIFGARTINRRSTRFPFRNAVATAAPPFDQNGRDLPLSQNGQELVEIDASRRILPDLQDLDSLLLQKTPILHRGAARRNRDRPFSV